MATIKTIQEGQTGAEVAKLLDDNFRALDADRVALQTQSVKGIAEAKELTEAETDRAKGVEEGLTKIVVQYQGDINGMKPQIQSLTKGVLDNANAIDAVRDYIDKLFTLDEATETIKTKYNFYSEKSIATKGVGSSSGGGGNSYGRLDNWDNYNASNGDVLSALLGYGLKSDIATLTSKFGNYFTKNETRNEIVAYLHDFNAEMIAPNYSTKSEVGSLADIVGGIGSRVSILEGKATAVSFAQTLQSGKQIGVLTIDGTATTLFAPASYAWGEISSRPTKLSDFTDDVVSGKYLSLSGGTLDVNKGLGFRHYSAIDGGGGWTYNFISFWDRNISESLAHIGVHGNDKKLNYIHIGANAYNGLNLCIGSNFLSWGDNPIIHSGNYTDYVYSKTQVDTKLGNYLPLSGGTMTGYTTIKTTGTLFCLRNSKGDMPYLNFRSDINGVNTDLGDLGVDPADKNLKYYNSGAWRTLIHSGNIGDYVITKDGGILNANTGIQWKDGYGNSDSIGNYFSVEADTSSSSSLATTKTRWTAILNVAGISSAPGYKFQLASYAGDGPNSLYYRGYDNNNSQWKSWEEIIHSGNIGSQSVANADKATYLKRQEITNIDNFLSADGMQMGTISNYAAAGWSSNDGVILSIPWSNRNFGAQLAFDDESNYMALRTKKSGTWQSWRKLAFTDSNVASATKLATARTIWGQSFDGSGNVGGEINSFYRNGEDKPAYRLTYDAKAFYLQSGNGVMYLSGYNVNSLSELSVLANKTYISNKVCIGTTTDSGYKLYVNGESFFAGTLGLAGSSKIYWHGDEKNYYIGTSYTINESSPNLDYNGFGGHRFIAKGVEIARITGNGNVLIGTTTDSGYKLYVNGTMYVNGNVTVGGTLKVGSILIEDKDGDLFVNGNVAASGSVATKGIGSSSSGGSATIPWSELENSLIAKSTSYNLGSSTKPWGSVYANSGVLGTLVSSQSGVTLTSYVMGQGNTWQISANGSASFASLTVGGANVSNSISGLNNSITALQQSTFTGQANTNYYRLTWFTSSGGNRNVDIPTYQGKGFASIEDLDGVFMADYKMVYDILDYVDSKLGAYATTANTYTKTQVNNNFAAKSEAEIVYSVSVTGDRNVAPSLNLDCGNGVWSLRNVFNGTNGDLKFLFDTQQKAQLTPAGDLTISGRLTQSSDETLKNILGYNVDMKVKDIANAPICYFTWKDRVSERQIGTIAQYWKLITPECVVGGEGRMSMDYSTLGLVSSIVNAREIVKHEDEIETLKRRVKELESEIAALKAA